MEKQVAYQPRILGVSRSNLRPAVQDHMCHVGFFGAQMNKLKWMGFMTEGSDVNIITFPGFQS